MPHQPRAQRDRRSDPLGPGGASGPVFALKADLFKVLGHPVRVRIIELLRDGERTVGSLQGSLGLDSSGTSQHLAALRKQGLVVGRREGASVHYRVTDRAVFDLLEVARGLLARALADRRAAMDELAGSLSPGRVPPA